MSMVVVLVVMFTVMCVRPITLHVLVSLVAVTWLLRLLMLMAMRATRTGRGAAGHAPVVVRHVVAIFSGRQPVVAGLSTTAYCMSILSFPMPVAAVHRIWGPSRGSVAGGEGEDGYPPLGKHGRLFPPPSVVRSGTTHNTTDC